jgi:GTPase SAR1 family protein
LTNFDRAEKADLKREREEQEKMVKFQSLKRQQKKRKTVVQIKTGSRIAQIIPKNNLIFDRV